MVDGRKLKTAYFCSQCGAEHPKWQGQCRECGVWNSLVEERTVSTKKAARSKATASERQLLVNVSTEKLKGYLSGIGEFDRVLGGQLIPGMTVLLAGDPGIGKSTLLLQAAESYSVQGIPVLYVTGEESLPQIKLRASRLKVKGENITVVNATTLEEITEIIDSGVYGIVLVDSIQTVASTQLDSPPGTISQLREAAAGLISQSKRLGHALVVIGHVTKEGLVAGPKLLEHMVDTVIYFEGDMTHLYRILRAAKNRFGSVAEIGLFEMGAHGLEEVTNPSSFFLSSETDSVRTGSVVASILEGNRPLLVEVQALVTRANYGTPQRVAGGIDNRKLALLLAILEKRGDFPMGSHDVFVSVAGGLKLAEPSLDLPITMAIASSLMNRPVQKGMMIVGEVGLSGEVRAITQIDKRLAEAAKLGFESAVIPFANRTQVGSPGLTVHPVRDIHSALERSLA